MSAGGRNKFGGKLQDSVQSRREAEERKREVAGQIFKRNPDHPRSKSVDPTKPAKAQASVKELPPVRDVVEKVKGSLIALYRGEEEQPSIPGSALIGLADLYLHAAEHRSRHIALVWPAPFKTLTLVHALATLARWSEGNKLGVRGLLFPVKSNAFNVLNHIHFDRAAVLRIANELLEAPHSENSRVKGSMPQKDAFLFALNESGPREGAINPTVGELLPHFLGMQGFADWASCRERLLALIRAKLVRRKIAGSLKELHCAVIGEPRTAPDALFALDGRMSEGEMRQALRKLAKLGAPEVVLISVTKAERLKAPNWKSRIRHFCLMLEEVFHARHPGVVIVTDEAHVAYKLRHELLGYDSKNDSPKHQRSPRDFEIRGFPSTAGSQGLLPPGVREILHPAPKEFDVYIVDADVAKVSSRLVWIASEVPGGKEAAKPITEAAAYLSRIAALPCGIRHLSEYLAGPDVAEHTRADFDWPARMGAIHHLDRSISIGERRPDLMKCIERGSQLYESYWDATNFAHRLANLVANAAISKRNHVVVVFTSALHRRLAERFLTEYDQYPEGVQFGDLQDQVQLISSSHLDECLESLQRSTLIFAGLNDDCLRLILTDDRVSAHSAILLTQRAGQFLRASLRPIVEDFPEFKSFKPRVESVLRQLKDLPDDSSILSTSDYVLPAFRVELSADLSIDGDGVDPDAWIIRLDNGVTQCRRENAEVYIYDPASQYSSDQGFKTCQVKSLEIGDKLFVMTTELREMVEQVLLDAGVPIQSDKTFEAALRGYHEQIQKRLKIQYPEGTLSEKVRALRKDMLSVAPMLEDYLPKEQAMRHWIDLGESPNTPFERLRPQAPLREATFKAFAQVLGFSPLEVAYQWQRVIMAVRNSRRLDGRHVSDIYAYMLLQPESVMTSSNIKRKTLTLLFDKARDSVATVERVGPIREIS